MNDIINVNITDLLLNLHFFQGLFIVLGIIGTIGTFHYKKMIFIILVLIGIIGYFKTNDKFNDNRDQRIIQCLNNAGIPVKTLAYITVAADRKTELTFTSTTSDCQSYKFNVLGEYWRPDTVKLQLNNN